MFKNFYLIKILISVLILASSSVWAGVDPTKPFGVSVNAAGLQVTKKGPLILESIIHGDKIHTVVINGQVMQVGDTIGEHRLVAVNDDSVVLRTPTERVKLSVFSGVVVK